MTLASSGSTLRAPPGDREQPRPAAVGQDEIDEDDDEDQRGQQQRRRQHEVLRELLVDGERHPVGQQDLRERLAQRLGLEVAQVVGRGGAVVALVGADDDAVRVEDARVGHAPLLGQLQVFAERELVAGGARPGVLQHPEVGGEQHEDGQAAPEAQPVPRCPVTPGLRSR
ncbi:MAG: hypothetical protein ACR2KP_19240 [Egibacteraceae bacterium]